MKRFFKRFFFAFCVLSVIVSLSLFSVSAVSADLTTYNDVTATNSQIVNLLSLRSDEELRKDYIGLRYSQNEYAVILADEFTVNGDIVSCGSCSAIIYDTSLGTSNATRYYNRDYDSCDINLNHIVVSNFLEGASRPDNTNFNDFIICAVVIIIVLLIFKVIRGFK